MNKQDDSQHDRSLLIFGAGKVGVAIGYLLGKQGYRVNGAVARSKKSLENIVHFIPGAKPLSSHDAEAIRETAATAGIILITTQDVQIQAACEKLVQNGAINATHTVMHMSGAIGLDALESAAVAGAGIAVIHPIQSFANIDLAIKRIEGSYFGMTIGEANRYRTHETALRIVEALSGTPIDIEDESKVIYHAAACVASNYLVTLLDLAKYLYERAGIPDDLALQAMLPLVEGTVSNIKELDTEQALTGPIARGDLSTVEHHVDQLKRLERLSRVQELISNEQPHRIIDHMRSNEAIVSYEHDAFDAYKALGRLTVDIALRRKSINNDTAVNILSLLDKNDR